MNLSITARVALPPLMVVSGCALDSRYAHALDPDTPQPAEAGEIDHRLSLIGDAGTAELGLRLAPVSLLVHRPGSEQQYRYRAMRKKLESVLRDHPSTQMMIASGHEHSIQIFELELCDAPKMLRVVSGSGAIDEHTPVGKGENTLMATPHAVFVVVDVLNSAGEPKSSEVLVSVIEVEKSNQVDPQNSSAVHS